MSIMDKIILMAVALIMFWIAMIGIGIDFGLACGTAFGAGILSMIGFINYLDNIGYFDEEES